MKTTSGNRVGLLAPAVLLLVGCAASHPTHGSIEPRSLGRDIPAFQASQEPQSLPGQAIPPEYYEPAGALTLADALRAALINSPHLATFSWSMRVQEAAELQARLRPNPELSAEFENIAGSGAFSGVDAAETTISLSQLLELGGKRAKRISLAEHEYSLASWDYETARMDVLTAATKAFVAVLVAQEQLLLADELVSVAEEALQSVARRVQAGSVSPVEESRARVEVEESRMDRNSTESDLSIAKQRLASVWGSATPQFTKVQGQIEITKPVPEFDDIRALVDQAPELARWSSELDQRRATLALARALGKPDLSVSAGVRHFSASDAGASALVVGLAMPIPVFDRNQGESGAAEYRLRAAAAEKRLSETRILTELGTTHKELVALDNEIVALRSRVLPEANNAFNTAQEAYRRGRMRFTDVVDTKRLLFELRARYYETLARHHGATADIERLIGASLETVTDPTEKP